jgi:hypothetical protein
LSGAIVLPETEIVNSGARSVIDDGSTSKFDGADGIVTSTKVAEAAVKPTGESVTVCWNDHVPGMNVAETVPVEPKKPVSQ